MTEQQARQKLESEGQAHVMRFWDRLDAAQRRALLSQVEGLDVASIRRMRALLRQSGGSANAACEPAPVVEWEEAGRRAAAAAGESELRAGRVGVVLVAGGQGSRLGFEGPKGAYPIGPVSEAVLFHFHCRKVLALGRRCGRPLPLYIMTSEGNDAATRAVFADHGWFGLAPEQVRFFTQGMWPALDADGRVILDAPGHIFMSPDGHGGTLSALAASGCLADMEQRNLSTLFYFQVDNPMVEIAEPAFIGLHLQRKAEISVKVCAKRDPQEGLGVVVLRDGRCAMVEYTELTDSQKNQRRPDGSLHFRYGSVAIHVFSLPFLKAEALKDMPLHVAHKKIPVCQEDGTVLTPASPNGYKFEKFIFDVLPDAETVLNLAFDRREEFSPVKNASGADSPETCKRDLGAKWARWLQAAGVRVPMDANGFPSIPIEIDPAYANSAEELIARKPAGIDVSRPILLADATGRRSSR